MAEMKKHTGGCHCGKYRFEVTTDLSNVIECNCSHCAKRGLLLTFISPDQFKLVSGEEKVLKEYLFNKKVIHHLFCPDCGIQPFARGTTPDGKAMCAVNVRCLDDLDLTTLKRTPVDGKRF